MRTQIILTTLTIVAAVSCLRVTLRNIGPMMCKGKCLRLGGCKSVEYYRSTLMCQLLSYKVKSMNTLTVITEDNTLNCNDSPPFSTVFIVKREKQRVCVPTGSKPPTEQKLKKKSSYKQQFLVASLHSPFTYYACAPNNLLKIEKQGDGSVKLQNIRAVNMCGRKAGRDYIVRGMTTAPCLNNIHSFCVYYLLDRKSRTLKNNLNLDLSYNSEPKTNGTIRSTTKYLTCPVSDSDSSSHVVGVSLDSEMSVYIIHRSVLMKFKLLKHTYSKCIFVRNLMDVGGIKSIQTYGNFLIIITDISAKLYDILMTKKDVREIILFTPSRNRIYCVDVVKNKVVIVPADDPQTIKFCDINIYNNRSRCDGN